MSGLAQVRTEAGWLEASTVDEDSDVIRVDFPGSRATVYLTKAEAIEIADGLREVAR